MRRTFLFNRPTLLLCLGVQTVVSLLWLYAVADQSLAAAPPPVTTSIIGSTVTGNVSTQVVLPPPNGKIYGIQGGQTVGSNLFHSFSQFNVGPGDIAQFQTSNLSPNAAIGNILGRVNGQQSPSQIFGTIDSATYYPAANLFLMNPYGFLFGPTATVNVGGMVAFTSADYLRLEGAGGSGTFYADAAKASILTSSPVAAFGFLGSNPGAITVQGSQLSVTPGQSISLVGGNITIQSGTLDNGTVQPALLSAQGGQINLASVASPGEVLAGSLNQAPNSNGQSFAALGSIQVLEQSHLDASGNGGGTVVIRGGQFLLDNSTISANVTGPGPLVNGTESMGAGIDIQVSQDAVIQNGAVIETNILGNATVGAQYSGVHVKADQIKIIGSDDLANAPFTGIQSDVGAGSTGGSSGNITLEANSILIQDLGTFTTTLETVTSGAGNAGNIALTANNNITLDGATIQSMSQSSPGNAGNIAITSAQGDISMPNFPLIQSSTQSGSGNAGSITVTAQGNISMDGPIISADSQGGTGDAGNITFISNRGNISLTNFPAITTQTLDSTGKAGNITVAASNGDILMTGGDFPGFILTAIRPPTGGAPRTAGSGQIDISAQNLTLLNSTISGDNISSVVPGNINLSLSGTLTLGGSTFQSKIQTTSRGPARSADLNITAHDIQISDGAILSTEAFAGGNAGALNIVTQNLQLINGGQVRSGSTSAVLNLGQAPSIPSGKGGTILIQGPDSPTASIIIDGSGSGIVTDAQGTGAGGNILVNTRSLAIQNGGTVSASTSGTASSATGGSINIRATDGVTMTNGGSITASSSGPGNAGNISIDAGQQLLMQNSSITTQAAQAGGGNINIQAINLLRMGNSEISTSVLGGGGSGGNITIDPNIVLLQNSQILAQAVRGTGGNISIATNLLLPDTASVISASSQFGQQGTITVQSPISPASGKILPLSNRPLLATSLTNQRCAALAGGNFSSFTIAGRDSLPAEPGGWLSTPLALASSEPGGGTLAKFGSSLSEGASGEETHLLSLRQIAPPGFLTQTFAVESSAGCSS